MPSSVWEGKVDRDSHGQTHVATWAYTDARDIIQLGIPFAINLCPAFAGEPEAQENSDTSLGKTKPMTDTPSSTASGTEGGEVLRGVRIFYRMGYLW